MQRIIGVVEGMGLYSVHPQFALLLLDKGELELGVFLADDLIDVCEDSAQVELHHDSSKDPPFIRVHFVAIQT